MELASNCTDYQVGGGWVGACRGLGGYGCRVVSASYCTDYQVGGWVGGHGVEVGSAGVRICVCVRGGGGEVGSGVRVCACVWGGGRVWGGEVGPWGLAYYSATQLGISLRRAGRVGKGCL